MARRTIEVDGERWAVYPSGRVTAYSRDEFGLVFEKGDGAERVRRVTRYAPIGARPSSPVRPNGTTVRPAGASARRVAARCGE